MKWLTLFALICTAAGPATKPVDALIAFAATLHQRLEQSPEWKSAIADLREAEAELESSDPAIDRPGAVGRRARAKIAITSLEHDRVWNDPEYLRLQKKLSPPRPPTTVQSPTPLISQAEYGASEDQLCQLLLAERSNLDALTLLARNRAEQSPNVTAAVDALNQAIARESAIPPSATREDRSRALAAIADARSARDRILEAAVSADPRTTHCVKRIGALTSRLIARKSTELLDDVEGIARGVRCGTWSFRGNLLEATPDASGAGLIFPRPVKGRYLLIISANRSRSTGYFQVCAPVSDWSATVTVGREGSFPIVILVDPDSADDPVRVLCPPPKFVKVGLRQYPTAIGQPPSGRVGLMLDGPRCEMSTVRVVRDPDDQVREYVLAHLDDLIPRQHFPSSPTPTSSNQPSPPEYHPVIPTRPR